MYKTIKIFILAIILNICSTLLAQEYTFNRLIQYEENGENDIHVYFNIDNPEYYLIRNDSTNKSVATIYDLKQNILHYYIVEPLQEENGLIYSYQYKESKNFQFDQSTPSTIYHAFEVQRDDKYYKFGTLDLYRDEAKNNLFLSAELVLRYTHEGLFPIFNSCCLLGNSHPIKDNDFAENMIVVKATITDMEGSVYNYKLVDDQVVQFHLKVPD